jgi:hypothetical protein
LFQLPQTGALELPGKLESVGFIVHFETHFSISICWGCFALPSPTGEPASGITTALNQIKLRAIQQSRIPPKTWRGLQAQAQQCRSKGIIDR